MKQDSPARTLAWMATGAAVLAAGALLGSTAGRRKKRGRRREDGAGLMHDPLEDLADRPVARAVLAENAVAARRVSALAESVASLEERVQAAESAALTRAEASAAQSAERIDAIWERVLQIEERLEQIRAERVEMPAFDALLAQAEDRLSPRLHVIEARVEEHHAVIEQLREQAAQTEANLQKMIAAVEKLTEQISRVLPAQAQRLEPQRESAGSPAMAASAGAGEAPRSLTGPPVAAGGQERGTWFRWKSLALVGAIAFSLAGSGAAVRKEALRTGALRNDAVWFHAAAAPAASASRERIAVQIDAAISALAALAEREPLEREWKYELGRLYSLKQDWSQAERWYRAVLAESPDDPRALRSLAEVLGHEGTGAPAGSVQ